jgi:hypothetical protein
LLNIQIVILIRAIKWVRIIRHCAILVYPYACIGVIITVSLRITSLEPRKRPCPTIDFWPNCLFFEFGEVLELRFAVSGIVLKFLDIKNFEFVTATPQGQRRMPVESTHLVSDLLSDVI